jgi:hypothetical protein
MFRANGTRERVAPLGSGVARLPPDDSVNRTHGDLSCQGAARPAGLLVPQIKQQLDPVALLDTPIQDAAGIAKWTNSIITAGRRCTSVSTPSSCLAAEPRILPLPQASSPLGCIITPLRPV